MIFPYAIVTEWSDEDACYIARVPALRHCVAHGDTPEEATREVLVGARMNLDVLGACAPEPDNNDGCTAKMSLSLPSSLLSAFEDRAASEGLSVNRLMI